MHKKIFSLLLAAAFAGSMLTGCKGQDTSAGEQPPAKEQPAAEEKDSVIVAMGPSSEPESGFDPAYG